jgi:fatty-acyl-CoA synthase
MEPGSRRETLTDNGLLRIEDCVDATGNVVLPPGATLVSLIDPNAANAGDSVAYRYLDHSRSVDGGSLHFDVADRLHPQAAALDPCPGR